MESDFSGSAGKTSLGLIPQDSSLPGSQGGRAHELHQPLPQQPSPSRRPPGEEGQAEEEQRTAGQGSLSSGPSGCAPSLPHQLLNPHPPSPTILILIRSQGQMGAGRENVTTEKALSSGHSVWGSQLCPLRPGQSFMPGLVSAQPGLKQISARGGGILGNLRGRFRHLQMLNYSSRRKPVKNAVSRVVTHPASHSAHTE